MENMQRGSNEAITDNMSDFHHLKTLKIIKAQRGAVKLIKKGKISSASILIVSEYFASVVFEYFVPLVWEYFVSLVSEYLVPLVFEYFVLWCVGGKKVTTQWLALLARRGRET